MIFNKLGFNRTKNLGLVILFTIILILLFVSFSSLYQSNVVISTITQQHIPIERRLASIQNLLYVTHSKLLQKHSQPAIEILQSLNKIEQIINSLPKKGDTFKKQQAIKNKMVSINKREKERNVTLKLENIATLMRTINLHFHQFVNRPSISVAQLSQSLLVAMNDMRDLIPYIKLSMGNQGVQSIQSLISLTKQYQTNMLKFVVLVKPPLFSEDYASFVYGAGEENWQLIEKELFNVQKIVDTNVGNAQRQMLEQYYLVRTIFLTVSLLLFLFAILFSYMLGRVLAEPAQSLINEIKQFSKKGLEYRITLNRKDVFGEVACEFNKLVDDLQNTMVSRDYVESIIKFMKSMLIVTDDSFQIKTVNPALLNRLGFQMNEILDQSLRMITCYKEQDAWQKFQERILHSTNAEVEVSFLAKDGECFPVLLMTAILPVKINSENRIICLAQDISGQKIAEEELRTIAHHDALTRLPNRLNFKEFLERECLMSKRHHRAFSILYVDLDEFKVVNDSFGHSVGDLLLIEVGNRIKSSLRETDFIARLGGDEFVILLPDIKHSHYGGMIANNLVSLFNEPFFINGYALKTTLSIGVVSYPEDGDSGEKLVKNADIAMYRAKSLGRNNYQFFTEELADAHMRRLEVEQALNFALEKNQLSVVYQPIIDLETNKITGVESLLRFHHPQLGEISPGEFISIAEEMGAIHSISNWLIEMVCQQCSAWLNAGVKLDKVTINISFRQLENAFFPLFLLNICKRTGVPPTMIELDINESALAQNLDEIRPRFVELHELGFSLALDDYGTGYSSLTSLRKLHIDTLKIDSCLIDSLSERKNMESIVQSLILFAKSLGYGVVAEGVETSERSRLLKNNHCEKAQGYFYNKPVGAEEISALLEKQSVGIGDKKD